MQETITTVTTTYPAGTPVPEAATPVATTRESLDSYFK